MTWRSFVLFRFLFEVVFQIAFTSSFNNKSFCFDHSAVLLCTLCPPFAPPLPRFILITLLLNASAFL